MAKSGYTKVPNEILEGIMLAKLTGVEYKVALAIIRRTLGFRKKEAEISLSYFRELTGLSRQGIKKAKRELEIENIISASRHKGKKTTCTLNNPLEWTRKQPLPDEPHKLGNQRSLALGNKRIPDQATTVAQTRTLSTKGRTIAKDTFKYTLKDNVKEAPPPDELSLEKSSSFHLSRKDNSTPAGSCESLQPHPFEEDFDPETLPPVDFSDLAGGDAGADKQDDSGPGSRTPVNWKDYADALPPELKDPSKFEAEAQEIAREFSEWELRDQFNQCMKQEDPEAALWGRALEIKLAEEGICQ